MNAKTETTPSTVADRGPRWPDFDTQLIGPINDSIIDAVRLTRVPFTNSFPNFELYRTALAGDELYVGKLRRWCVEFSLAFCAAGGVRKDAYSEELATVAAWDALFALLYCRELAPLETLAEDVGVHHKTYRRLRDILYRLWHASLHDYWCDLGSEFRRVEKRERQVRNGETGGSIGWGERVNHRDFPTPKSLAGLQFDGGNGNYYALRAPNPDNL